MDDMPIGGHDRTEDMARYLLSRYDVPAYVRRARQVEDTYQDLLAHCARQRDEWLEPMRQRVATLWALIPSMDKVDVRHALQELRAMIEPLPEISDQPAFAARLCRRLLLELRDEIERFNRRWRDFLIQIDLTPINRVRADYNRYYLLEKECAVRSIRLASKGYWPLQMVSVAELEARWPLLPELRLTIP